MLFRLYIIEYNSVFGEMWFRLHTFVHMPDTGRGSNSDLVILEKSCCRQVRRLSQLPPKETRERWPLLTVYTEVNGDSKSTMKGVLPWLVRWACCVGPGDFVLPGLL
jgi:hypothetical protein